MVDELRAGRAGTRAQRTRGRVGPDRLLGPKCRRGRQRAAAGAGDRRRRRGRRRLGAGHAPSRERHPDSPLFPSEDPARVRCELFCDWFNEVWRAAPHAIEAELARDDPDREAVAELTAHLGRHLDVFERMLAAGDYLFAGFSAADCAAYPFLKYALGRDPADDEPFHLILDEHQSVEGRPRLAASIERVGQRPMAFPRRVEGR